MTMPAAAEGEALSADAVLVRIGEHAAVTQGDFEWTLKQINPAHRESFVANVMGTLVQRALVLEYLAEHPDLVTEQELEEELLREMKKAKQPTLEAFRKQITDTGIEFEKFKDLIRIRLVKLNLAKRGLKRAQDPENRKALYSQNPEAFNGARITVRHILLTAPETVPKEYRERVKARAEKIREDLVTGRRSWEECVKESHCNTRAAGGMIGGIPRYGRLPEPIMQVIWNLPVGEYTEVLDSGLGYEILQVVGRSPGYRDYDDKHTQIRLQSIMQKLPLANAVEEMHEKYDIVGVRSPDLSRLLPKKDESPSAAETQPATQAGS
jgi:peptidyl-prolyl cis-trans isomerase SurA